MQLIHKQTDKYLAQILWVVKNFWSNFLFIFAKNATKTKKVHNLWKISEHTAARMLSY